MALTEGEANELIAELGRVKTDCERASGFIYNLRVAMQDVQLNGMAFVPAKRIFDMLSAYDQAGGKSKVKPEDLSQ